MQNMNKKVNTKNPTGKSATGKPLEGIDVEPQLNNVNKTNGIKV